MKRIWTYFGVLLLASVMIIANIGKTWGQGAETSTNQPSASTNRRGPGGTNQAPSSTNMRTQPRTMSITNSESGDTNLGAPSSNGRPSEDSSDVSTSAPESRPTDDSMTNVRPSGAETNQRPPDSMANTNQRPPDTGRSTNNQHPPEKTEDSDSGRRPESAGSDTTTEETFLYAMSPPVMLEYGYEFDPSYDATQFFPIGFSKEGLFAYVLFDDYIEGVGDCTKFHVIVQDLVTDDIEYEYTFIEEFVSMPFDKVWEMMYEEFDDQLSEYNIQSDDFEMEYFPIINKKDVLTYEFKMELDEKNMIDSFELLINSEEKGNKVIHDQKDTEAIIIKILGYIDSPLEDRVAVILMKTFKGEDGPPLPVTVFPVGCHLENGF